MFRRRMLRLVAAALLLGAAVWYGVGQRPAGGSGFTDLESVLAPEDRAGWRIARPPDRAGPYRRDGEPTPLPRGGIGSVTVRTPAGPATVRLPARADAEQMAVVLQTADGFATVVVLER